jgi:hypothetical protein
VVIRKKQQSTNTDTDQCWGGYLILLITVGFGNLNISESENHHLWCVFFLKIIKEFRMKELWVLVISKTSRTYGFHERTGGFRGGNLILLCVFFLGLRIMVM